MLQTISLGLADAQSAAPLKSSFCDLRSSALRTTLPPKLRRCRFGS